MVVAKVSGEIRHASLAQEGNTCDKRRLFLLASRHGRPRPRPGRRSLLENANARARGLRTPLPESDFEQNVWVRARFGTHRADNSDILQFVFKLPLTPFSSPWELSPIVKRLVQVRIEIDGGVVFLS